jgi:hypothetical protein
MKLFFTSSTYFNIFFLHIVYSYSISTHTVFSRGWTWAFQVQFNGSVWFEDAAADVFTLSSRFNWKLDGTTDPILRKLCHKDLRCWAGDFAFRVNPGDTNGIFP